MRMHKMMVSIIVPCYNTGNYLRKCVNSILTQTYRDFELIIVDDGSTDGSSEICDEFKENDKRVRVVHQNNRGLVRSRKIGIGLARAEYILFIDSDDWIIDTYVQEMVNATSNGHFDVVAASAKFDYQGGTVECHNSIIESFDTGGDMQNFRKQMLCCKNYFVMGILPYLWNKLIRADLLRDCISVVPDNIEVGEDVAFLMTVLLKARSIRIMEGTGYHYCVRTGSMMDNNEPEREKSNVVALHHYLYKIFSENEGFSDLMPQLRRFSVHHIFTRCLYAAQEFFCEICFFPYRNVQEGDCVSVYGAGAFGKSLYRELEKNKKIKTGQWIDQNAEVYKNNELNIVSPDEMHIDDATKIVIAVLDLEMANSIKNDILKKYGVSQKSVEVLSVSERETDDLLASMGMEVF